jgi:hypothetical protein
VDSSALPFPGKEDNLNLLGKYEDIPKKLHKIRRISLGAAFNPAVSNCCSSKQRKLKLALCGIQP